LTTITNTILLQLSSNLAYVREFPFLKIRQSPVASCCSQQASRNIDFNNAKVKIASLSGDRLKRFKEIVGADEIKVLYKNGNKVLTKLL